jgi:hypothetical protein
MPKPYVPANKKTLYGTQARPPRDKRDDPPWLQEYARQPRPCAICGEDRPGEWYELMQEGWVCDPCRPKATHIKRESQPEIHAHDGR